MFFKNAGSGARRRTLRPVLMTFFALFLISLIFCRYNTKRLRGRWVSLDSQVSAVVKYRSGATRSVRGTHFGVLNRGDRVFITVALPDSRKIPDSALCFDMVNTAVSVRAGSRLLASYGGSQDAAGRQIGDVFYRIPLPDGAWGKSVRVSCRVTENGTECRLLRPTAVSRMNSIRYFIFRYDTNLPFFLSIFMLFLLSFLIFLFFPSRQSAQRQGLWLSLFCMLLSAWYLSSNGFLYAVLDSTAFCANLEYAVLFAVPIPLCLFLRAMNALRDERKYLTAMSAFFLSFFAAATVLNFTTRLFHYCTLLRFLGVCVLLGLIPIIVRLVQNWRSSADVRRRVRNALIFSALVAALEIAQYGAARSLGRELLRQALSSLGILAFTGVITMGYLTRLAELYDAEKNQDVLARIAFVDILTGLSNRAFCQREMERLGQAGMTAYVILFFDVNKLKYANDEYGHEMGDRLLRYVAASLQATFWGQQFCGRWGGDEFIVCLTGSAIGQRSELLRQFQTEISRANVNRSFPFRVSVACGMAESSAERPLSFREAIKAADHQMYRCKCAVRFSR